ncbi:MAG TPA: hypothetical protein DEP42_00385 [Ruminococcaceae bacterium]|nr:hypothetical protein [Oscillospiraceae bacterium]
MIVIVILAFPSPNNGAEQLGNLWFFVGCFSYIPYVYGGTYLVGILMGIHLGRKKRISKMDILFSTGIWLLLSAIYFRVPLAGINRNTASGRLLLLWVPALGSTIAFFLSGIITLSIRRLRK